jgi:hypothetical protein
VHRFHSHCSNIYCLLLLPARAEKAKIHCTHNKKYFLKFNFEQSFVVDADEGGMVYKYVHCSNGYAILFRDVLPTAKVSVEIVFSHDTTDKNVIAATYNGNKYEYEFVPGVRDGEIITTKYFTERVKLWLCVNNLGVTMQQKVEHKYIGLYKLIKLETPHG